MYSRETEILDVAPVDIFNGMSKNFLGDWPENFIPAELKDQCLDITFHWVNEKGGDAKLTGGLTIKATVGVHNSGLQLLD